MNQKRHIIPLGGGEFLAARDDISFAIDRADDARLSTRRPSGSGRIYTASDILGTLRRRVRLVTSASLVVFALIALVIMQLTPKYDGEAVIILEARTAQIANIQDVMPALPTDNPALHAAVIRSELDVLMSRPLARRVITELGLANKPEFNPVLRTGPGWFGGLFFWMDEQGQMQVEEAIAAFLKQLKPGSDAADEHDPDPLSPVIDAYLEHLRVRNDGKSLTFRLSFRSKDPDLAARVVNAHARAYLDSQIALKVDATQQANRWLSQKVEALRGQVTESERAVQAYRVQHKLNRMPGKDAASSIYAQQLAEMNAQLVAASADRAQAEAKLAQVKDLLRSGASAESVPEVLNSSTIQRLREQEAQLMRMEAEIAERYMDNHPPLLNVRAQLRGLRRQINHEIQNIVRSLSNDVEIARTRERVVEKNVEQLRASLSNVDMAEVKLWELEREASARRELLQTFLARLEETSAGSPHERADARVASWADVPDSPSFPRRKLLLAAGFVFSLLVGAGLALVVDRSDSRVRSSDEVESLTDVPTFGLVPVVENTWRRKMTAARAVIDDPMSSYAEAIRSVRTALTFSDPGTPPVSIVVTSALPQEGKTTLAASLARSSALAGRKTILVDCDLRRPGVAALLRQPTVSNIVDVLTGKMRLEDVIHRDDATGLDFVAAPSNVWNSTDLLGSPQFAELLRNLENTYERVYIDTPPILAVSDALAVAQSADALLFAVRWGTPEHVVATALRQVRSAHLNLTGTVVTHVDLRRHAKLGYKDAGQYYGKYQARSA